MGVRVAEKWDEGGKPNLGLENVGIIRDLEVLQSHCRGGCEMSLPKHAWARILRALFDLLKISDFILKLVESHWRPLRREGTC